VAAYLVSGAAVQRHAGVTPRGFRKWLTRPMSQRQRGDMKVLAHIREQYGLSLGSYGRPRMTMELKEAGLDVGDAHPDSGNSTKQACVAQRFPVKLPKGQYIQFVR